MQFIVIHRLKWEVVLEIARSLRGYGRPFGCSDCGRPCKQVCRRAETNHGALQRQPVAMIHRVRYESFGLFVAPDVTGEEQIPYSKGWFDTATMHISIYIMHNTYIIHKYVYAYVHRCFYMTILLCILDFYVYTVSSVHSSANTKQSATRLLWPASRLCESVKVSGCGPRGDA